MVEEDEDGPAATVHQNTDTGAVELDIDISVLDRPRPPAIVTKLLGTNWRVRHPPLIQPSVPCPDVSPQSNSRPLSKISWPAPRWQVQHCPS